MLDSDTAVSIVADRSDVSVSKNQQNVPAWSAFSAFTSDTSCAVASVHYMPFRHDKRTTFGSVHYTVHTAMIQNHILVTADPAIYIKAQQILWRLPTSLQGKMRPGGIHITMSYLIASASSMVIAASLT